MSYQVYFGSSLVTADTLKASLTTDTPWQDAGDASLNAKNISTLAGGMPVRIACNTISSLTFGGSLRGWTVAKARAAEAVEYELDLDDWRMYLNRELPYGFYSNVRMDSIIRSLISKHTTSFTVEINSYFNSALLASWQTVNAWYYHDKTVSEALDELVTYARTHTNYDQTQPPVWGVGPDRVVRVVGYANSYGTTVTVDDADLDLRAVQIGMVANEMVTRAWVWGGSTTAPSECAAGASSLLVDDRERFYGNPNSLSFYDGAKCYVASGAEMIEVLSTVASTGNGWIGISSLNTNGEAHGVIAGASVVRAVLMQPAATSSFNVVGSITGESSHWDKKMDGVVVYNSNTTYPSTWTYIGHAMLRLPSQEVGYFRCWTVNSQVAVGGRLAVSLTANGVVPGLYTVQRVRISGFDLGESRPPIYEVEAGPQPRYRIDSLL